MSAPGSEGTSVALSLDLSSLNDPENTPEIPVSPDNETESEGDTEDESEEESEEGESEDEEDEEDEEEEEEEEEEEGEEDDSDPVEEEITPPPRVRIPSLALDEELEEFRSAGISTHRDRISLYKKSVNNAQNRRISQAPPQPLFKPKEISFYSNNRSPSDTKDSGVASIESPTVIMARGLLLHQQKLREQKEMLAELNQRLKEEQQRASRNRTIYFCVGVLSGALLSHFLGSKLFE